MVLIGLKRLYIYYNKPFDVLPECEMNPNKVAEIMSEILLADSPCMITRFGAVEISALNNYQGIIAKKRNILKFIVGKEPEWWWNEGIRYAMTNNAGFYPASNDNLMRFSRMMMDCITSIDILGSWQSNEKKLINYFPNAKLINFVFLDPFWSENPWTKVLEGKNVLVVHPFSELIEYQYINNRDKLFTNKDILPLFNLKVIKAIQSIGGNSQFTDWFAALEFMKSEIDKVDFDICLIGAGAYGLPLAAYIKHKGKKVIHIGGTLQLLFGIWGKRWDNPEYASKQLKRQGAYLTLKNEFWTLPGKTYQPLNYKQIEDGCYW